MVDLCLSKSISLNKVESPSYSYIYSTGSLLFLLTAAVKKKNYDSDAVDFYCIVVPKLGRSSISIICLLTGTYFSKMRHVRYLCTIIPFGFVWSLQRC